MKEITMITTAQITDVVKVADDFDIAKCKEHTVKTGGGVIKELLGSDGVVVTDVQLFVRDIEPKE